MGNLVEIAKKSHLSDGNMIEVKVNGNKIIVAQIKGKYYAADSTCTHALGRLDWGVLDGTTIQCPKHQLAYDITTGKVVRPGKCGASAGTVSPLKTYPVKVEGDSIKIDI